MEGTLIQGSRGWAWPVKWQMRRGDRWRESVHMAKCARNKECERRWSKSSRARGERFRGATRMRHEETKRPPSQAWRAASLESWNTREGCTGMAPVAQVNFDAVGVGGMVTVTGYTWDIQRTTEAMSGAMLGCGACETAAIPSASASRLSRLPWLMWRPWCFVLDTATEAIAAPL